MKNLKTFLISRESSPFRDIAVLLTFFGVSFFLFLGKYGLIEPDEGRYAEIPREMLEKGDFITPTLNYVHYFEKPPLHYWLTALSFKLFGLNEFAARFTGVCAGLLTIVIVYHTARILFDRRAGFFSACILGLSTGFAVQSRINLTDMTLTFFLTTALCCFMFVCAEQVRSKQLYLCLFYLAAGCSVLTKGLIGIVLPGGIIFLYLLLTRNWSQLRQLRPFMGGLLFLAVVAPWFILVSLRNPGFAQFFFIHEHFQRYVSTIHHHYQPFWYFAPILLLLMLPWSPYIIRSIRTALRVSHPPERRLTTFLVLWLTLIFAFFSFSQSKLIPYILPVIPPLAMLMGKMFSDRVEQHEDSFFAIEHVFMCVVLFAAALLMAFYPHVREFGGQLTATGLVRPTSSLLTKTPLVTPAGGLALACLALAMVLTLWLANKKRDIILLFLGLAFCSYLLEIVGPQLFIGGIADRKSSRDLALVARGFVPEGSHIASFGYDQSLPFYAATRTIVVGPKGELEYGSNQAGQTQWFIDEPAFLKLWRGEQRVVVLLQKSEYQQMAPRLEPSACTLAEKGRKILITNRVAAQPVPLSATPN